MVPRKRLQSYQFCLKVLILIIFIGLLSFKWTIEVKIFVKKESETLQTLFEPLNLSFQNVKQPDGQWKRILFWNEAYKNDQTFDIGLGKDVFRKANCPVWQCETTSNRSSYLIESYDAVIFNQRRWSPFDLPLQRSTNQRYVFWSRESPAWRYTNTHSMAEFFNWTMTYRWDSDIVYPFGWITLIDSNLTRRNLSNLKLIKTLLAKVNDDSTNYAAGKTKKVAWSVPINNESLSARDEYIIRLKEFIDVKDMYGETANQEACHRILERDYKFYFAMEDSLCGEYVTDIFFARMRCNIVPIVFDLHGHYKRLAPPHSFINAADFKSVKLLADYLISLDENDSLYNEFFWWKKHYIVHDKTEGAKRSMCQLCNMLHNSNKPEKIYKDMTTWWDIEANCQTIKFKKHEDAWKAMPMLLRWFG